MAQERYLIGPGLRSKLREVIRRVDGLPQGGPGSEIPTRLQDPRRAGGTTLRVGTFTGSWQTGTFKTVTITGSTQTISVYNWCNAADGAGTATKYVLFGLASGTQSVVEIQGTTGTSSTASTATCTMTIGGTDLGGLPSFNPLAVQVLGHDAAGCLKWFDVTACSTSA